MSARPVDLMDLSLERSTRKIQERLREIEDRNFHHYAPPVEAEPLSTCNSWQNRDADAAGQPMYGEL